MRASLILRGLRGRTGLLTASASAVAVASSALAWCETASDTLSDVELTERPQEKWIENSQHALADALVDWNALDMCYVGALRTIREAYSLPLSAMQAVREHFLAEAKAGLAGTPSSVRMLPTYVTSRVTGSESGDFYALDLGGTNFRVLKLTLEGGGKVGPVTQGKFKVPNEIKQGTGEGLFGFLADSIASFLATKCGGNPKGVLGFTFSFPTEQDAINRGKLIIWNKEFSASDVVGHDVVGLLQTELVKRGINLEVRALANDTVGTMEAAAYAHPDTTMGVILGTGTNAAYIEKTSNVGKWQGPPSAEMVINTEWGNLDMEQIMTVYDAAIDAASQNPGLQRYEKMISGMYLGELCRVSVISPPVIEGFSSPFGASLSSKLADRMSLPTSLVAAIEADSTPDLSVAAKALADAGLSGSTVRDRVLLREAAVCVSTRAARLSAMGVVALLEQLEHSGAGCTIAIDGTVFECYPYFKERMEHGLEMLKGREGARSIELVLAKDGSGVGAAIIAAISSQM